MNAVRARRPRERIVDRRKWGEEGDRDGQRGEFRLGDRGESFILESTGVNVYSWSPMRDAGSSNIRAS